MVVCSPQMWSIVNSSPGGVKAKGIKLIFVVYPLSMHH